MYTGASERALILIGSFVIILVFTWVYERLRTEGMSVTFTEADYEEKLTALAANHRGKIDWITKTTIWADLPEAYSGRRQAKAHGIATGRLTCIRYIVHLGYWRRYVIDDLLRNSSIALELYHTKITNLLASARDYEQCPPEKVQLVIGETNDGTAPPYRLGLYRGRRKTTVILGFDLPHAQEQQPRIEMRGSRAFWQYYQRLFDNEWERYARIAKQPPHLLLSEQLHLTRRKAFIDYLYSELEWIAAHSVRQDEELTSTALFRDASTCLDSGRAVVLSCPQKVCLSGDYGDMWDGGVTLTAAVNIRPHIIARKLDAGESRVTVNDSAEEVRSWPLVNEFCGLLVKSEMKVEIKVYPTEYSGFGLGSSGAGAVLLASTLALVQRQTLSKRELIDFAHHFETKYARWPCGKQDHFSAVLGCLRLIEYPLLQQKRLPYHLSWRQLSFWIPSKPRHAHDIIPAVFRDHTRMIWSIRAQITRNMADALSSNNVSALIEAFRTEFNLQDQVHMLTSSQRDAIEFVMSMEGGAKVSGAGGGGVLVVVTPNVTSLSAIQLGLVQQGYSELKLSVDTLGLTMEHGGR